MPARDSAETQMDEGFRVRLDVPPASQLIELYLQDASLPLATGQCQAVTEAGKRFDVSREAGRLLQFWQGDIELTKRGEQQPEFTARLDEVRVQFDCLMIAIRSPRHRTRRARARARAREGKGTGSAAESRRRDSGVWRAFDGFESQRAIDVGRQVAREVEESRVAERASLPAPVTSSLSPAPAAIPQPPVAGTRVGSP